MKTTLPIKENILREWYLVDANGQTLGRLAVQIANVLRGRHKPIYTPHIDTGDFVVVINAEKVRVSGKKETDKMYARYSGFRGGYREHSTAEVRQRHPDWLIRLAVKGMMPNNTLHRQTLRRLKIYAGDKHPHIAQNPKTVELVKGKGAKRG